MKTIIIVLFFFLLPGILYGDNFRIGGVPLSRNLYSSLFSSNSYYSNLRSRLESSFGIGKVVPNRTMEFVSIGNASFQASDLAMIDLFVVDTKISYTSSEANLLYDFVLGGGNLFIYSDYSDSANANTIAQKFGVTFANAWNPSTYFPVQQGASFVTSGPFGDGDLSDESGYTGNNAVSQISHLGSHAIAVASLNSSFHMMALITPGKISPGSGAVLFYNDWVADTFGGHTNATTQNLILNFFANTSSASHVPEPSTWIFGLLFLFISIFYKALGKK